MCKKFGYLAHNCKDKKVEKKRGKLSQMVTYLICDLRKEFFKRVQARFR